MVTARTVCAKTGKGQEEIERRTNGLSPRLRQMLILMDGRRDTAALQIVFPAELVPGLVQQLLDGGFVAELDPAPAEFVIAPPVAPAPDDLLRLREREKKLGKVLGDLPSA